MHADALVRRMTMSSSNSRLTRPRHPPAIRGTIYFCFHVIRLNPLPLQLLYPRSDPLKLASPPRPISPAEPATGRISVKTIIKRRMPFSPSCIMNLGSLFVTRICRLLRHSRLAKTLVRPRLAQPCRSPRPRPLARKSFRGLTKCFGKPPLPSEMPTTSLGHCRAFAVVATSVAILRDRSSSPATGRGTSDVTRNVRSHASAVFSAQKAECSKRT
jgi:hypothetical protein